MKQEAKPPNETLPEVDQPTVWVVLPTYNERENIQGLVEAILRVAPRGNILVVDDNSPDGTGQIADGLAARDPRVAVLHRLEKRGLGAAYRSGMREAISRGAEWLIQMDCDFSHDPAAIPNLLAQLAQGADVVLGTRYALGGRTENWSRMRQAISRIGNRVAQVILGLRYTDITGGFKAWRADLLETIDFESVQASGYGFQVEMTWRAHQVGARIDEVPIVFRERVAGQSKMTTAIILEAILMLFRLRFRGSPSHATAP